MSLCDRVHSEVLAAEAVSCLNRALSQLKDIWEQIGLSEDQRLQRTNAVKQHIQVRLLGVFCSVCNRWRLSGFFITPRGGTVTYCSTEVCI